MAWPAEVSERGGGVGERTRTSTPLRALGPQPSASTSSATPTGWGQDYTNASVLLPPHVGIGELIEDHAPFGTDGGAVTMPGVHDRLVGQGQ